VRTVVQASSGSTTATNQTHTIDLAGRLSGTLTATLPSAAANGTISLVVTTTGPDGKVAMGVAKQAIIMDVSQSAP